jgi:hypothetical protein
MARDHNGTNQNTDFGSDPTIDDVVPLVASCWFVRDTLNQTGVVISKMTGVTAGWGIFNQNNSNSNRLSLKQVKAGGLAEHDITSAVGAGTMFHVMGVYDSSVTANDPAIYLNGVLQTFAVDINSTGAAVSDAGASLRIGEASSGHFDHDVAVQNLLFDAGAGYGAADANRMRWWGRRGGTPKVYHPLFTTKLTNEGSATANGTANGSTMRALPRVERCWGSMMGCGR